MTEIKDEDFMYKRKINYLQRKTFILKRKGERIKSRRKDQKDQIMESRYKIANKMKENMPRFFKYHQSCTRPGSRMIIY